MFSISSRNSIIIRWLVYIIVTASTYLTKNSYNISCAPMFCQHLASSPMADHIFQQTSSTTIAVVENFPLMRRFVPFEYIGNGKQSHHGHSVCIHKQYVECVKLRFQEREKIISAVWNSPAFVIIAVLCVTWHDQHWLKHTRTQALAERSLARPLSLSLTCTTVVRTSCKNTMTHRN